MVRANGGRKTSACRFSVSMARNVLIAMSIVSVWVGGDLLSAGNSGVGLIGIGAGLSIYGVSINPERVVQRFEWRALVLRDHEPNFGDLLGHSGFIVMILGVFIEVLGG